MKRAEGQPLQAHMWCKHLQKSLPFGNGVSPWLHKLRHRLYYQSGKAAIMTFNTFKLKRMCDNNNDSFFSESEVQGFIAQLDSIINRMGSNSANAKNWLMTIIAAAIAIQWSQDQLSHVLWLLIPTILFMLTDLYYLGMERHFKELQKAFIDRVRDGKDIADYVYSIPKTTKCEQACNTIKALDSLSIWPFYGIIIVVIFAIFFFNGSCFS